MKSWMKQPVYYVPRFEAEYTGCFLSFFLSSGRLRGALVNKLTDLQGVIRIQGVIRNLSKTARQ